MESPVNKERQLERRAPAVALVQTDMRAIIAKHLQNAQQDLLTKHVCTAKLLEPQAHASAFVPVAMRALTARRLQSAPQGLLASLV